MRSTSTTDQPDAIDLSIEVVSRPECFTKLESDWNILLSRHSGRNPFLTFEWMTSWIQTLGQNTKLFTIVVRAPFGVVGIAPFCIRSGGLLTFIGYPQSDYADLLVDPGTPGVLKAVVDTLYENRRAWKKALLNQWPEEGSHWRAVLAVLERENRPHRLELADPCPAMVLDDLAVAKKKYYKRNITTYINWYKDRGELAHEIYADTGLAMERLEDLFAQHTNRWAGSASPSSFLREDMKDFYRSFLRAMHAKGWAKLTGLTLDDQFLALYLFFEYENTMYLYKTSFNLEYRKRSPGQVILRFLFDHAAEQNIQKMDFVRGDEGYKSRFANVSHQNRRILLYQNFRSRLMASLNHSIRHSQMMDILYRNSTVQGLRYRVLQAYHNRRARG